MPEAKHPCGDAYAGSSSAASPLSAPLPASLVRQWLAHCAATRLPPVPVIEPPAPTAREVAEAVVGALALRSEKRLAPTPLATGPSSGASPDVELLRAQDVGMTRRAWRAAIHRGELRASKLGREYLATRADYEAYLEAKRVTITSKSRPRPRKSDPASDAVERALASGQLRAITRSGRTD